MAIDIFTESTLKKIYGKLQVMNEYVSMIAGQSSNISVEALDSIESVAEIVKAGLAESLFAIGDQITVPYTDASGTTYDYVWDIAHFGDVELEDGSTVPGMFLQSHYATAENMVFDMSETEKATEETAVDGYYYYGYDGSNYTLLELEEGDEIPYDDYTSIYHNEIKDTTFNIIKTGYNRWSHSVLRQWLNSSEAKGNWWMAQHVGDKEPTSVLTAYNGFMAGFEDDFLGVLKPVKVTTLLNTVTDSSIETSEDTYDIFFAPSIEQVYGSPQSSGYEGDYFEYWKEATGLSSPSNNVVSGRILYGLNATSSAQSVRLRSASRGDAYSVWSVNTSGSVSNYPASTAYRCAPACVIC